MRQLWRFTLALCVLLCVSCGTLLEIGPDDPCYYKQAFRKATFTPARYTYEFTGTCDLVHTRLALPTRVPWTAVGTYDPPSGATTEVITVPAPAISEPSRPYGQFRASLRCVNDPWLLQQDPKCVLFSALSNPPPTAFPLNTPQHSYFRDVLNSILDTIKYTQLPYTSYLTDEMRKTVNAQYQTYVAAQRREQQLLQGAAKSPGSSYSASLSPTVLAPTAGMVFIERTPMPIKLAPPKGWSVIGYMVNIETKDANGKWVAHATIPVGAAQAHSAAGYTGFGAGAPPAFLSVPGKWRLAAQVSYPKQSGWSNWTEFSIMSHLRRGPRR